MSLFERHCNEIQNSIQLNENKKVIFSFLEKAFLEVKGHKLFTILKFDKTHLRSNVFLRINLLIIHYLASKIYKKVFGKNLSLKKVIFL